MSTRKRTRKRTRKNPRGITRIDQESTRTHGWFVRVGWRRRRDGSYAPRHTRFFGDITHGGKRKALAAAEVFVAKVSKVKVSKVKVSKVKKAKAKR